MHFSCAGSLYDYTCAKLEALYIKHYNNTQSNSIMPYISHSIPLSFVSTPTQVHTHTHTQSHNPPLPPSPSFILFLFPANFSHTEGQSEVTVYTSVTTTTPTSTTPTSHSYPVPPPPPPPLCNHPIMSLALNPPPPSLTQQLQLRAVFQHLAQAFQ